MTEDTWTELDLTAMVNLDADHIQRFQQYKAELKAKGHKWEHDACDILKGYIWDESEVPYENRET